MSKLGLKIAKAGIEKQLIRRTLHFIFVKIPRKIFGRDYHGPMLPHIRYVRNHIETDNKTILFVSFRNMYDCNPRAICEEILRQKLPYRLVAVTTEETEHLYPENVKKVWRDTFPFYREAARAKILIDNSINLETMCYRKKKDQILIETWHGAIGIKKFVTASNKAWVKKARKEGRLTDYCISNSGFETDLYKSTLWPEAEILEYGHPRNDILFNQTPEQREEFKNKICEKYGIPKNKKICLYAPTFRDDKDPSPYKISYQKLIDALQARFGGEWAILTRFHQRVKQLYVGLGYGQEVYNVSDFPDIQDLLTITDCGITDYSSWICEYLLTGRPGFLFATDARKYTEHERELVYPLDSTPFPLAENQKQLFENIRNFDNDKFLADRNAFLEKYRCVDDGQASKRVVEKIKELMGEEK